MAWRILASALLVASLAACPTIPRTCQPDCTSRSCGDDGCGGSCGSCTGGESCTSSKCVACAPTTCEKAGKDCGTIPDLCGETAYCGECSSPKRCGGAGVSNVCGCSPRSCRDQLKDCGSLSDGCGTVLDCGVCPTGKTCGGGGVPNECGAGQTCASESDLDFCARLGAECGPVAAQDNCDKDRTVDCGLCETPQSCGGSGAANVCGGGSRGIWVWGSSIKGAESAFLDWAQARKFTDVFILIKGVSGTVAYEKLDAALKARAQKKQAVRIWAWVVGFNDQDHQSWKYLVNDRVSPLDTGYRAYLASVVRKAIDPAKGMVSEPPDGVMLDDTFGWPGHTYGASATERVGAIAATVDAIKAELDATRALTGKSLLLGFAPLPETAAVKTDATSILTASANEYGQDFGEIGKRCDWILPETYRYGFYGNTSAWIGQVVTAIHKELALEVPSRVGQISVYPALVLYQSDETPTAVAGSEVKADVDVAMSAVGGFSLFRYASGSTLPGTGSDGKDWPTAEQLSAIAVP